MVGLVDLVVEQADDAVHCFAHRVVGCEGIVLEQGFEDRLRDDMLRQHLDGLWFGDGGVDVLVQSPKETIESFTSLLVVIDKRGNLFDMLFGNFGHVVGPLLPVAFAAHLLHHAGENDILQLLEAHLQLCLQRCHWLGCFETVAV